MNYYIHARLAQQRLDQTARQARTAWWRSHPPTAEKPEAETLRLRLHWIAPVAARVTGAKAE
jgi:hypothetical protein